MKHIALIGVGIVSAIVLSLPTAAATNESQNKEVEEVIQVAATTPVATTTPVVEPKEVRIEIVYTDERVRELAKEIAEAHGVSFYVMDVVITCESGWDYDIDSKLRYTYSDPARGIYRGELEQSFGLAQIHLPHWPDITEEQAKDPVFALNFMAKKLATGKGYLWTCYRNNFV